jgi:hypothetical protein
MSIEDCVKKIDAEFAIREKAIADKMAGFDAINAEISVAEKEVSKKKKELNAREKEIEIREGEIASFDGKVLTSSEVERISRNTESSRLEAQKALKLAEERNNDAILMEKVLLERENALAEEKNTYKEKLKAEYLKTLESKIKLIG